MNKRDIFCLDSMVILSLSLLFLKGLSVACLLGILKLMDCEQKQLYNEYTEIYEDKNDLRVSSSLIMSNITYSLSALPGTVIFLYHYFSYGFPNRQNCTKCDVEECIFDYIALRFECRCNQNTLLQSSSLTFFSS